MTNKLAKSPWLLHYDGSSCNGCDIEVLACTTPKYDIERFGIINTGDPFQADILLITGGVNHQSESVIRQIYTQMPEPKVVVAVGICACTGGVFKDCYNIKGGIDTVIPVDVYVPGCAARPQAIIDGVVQALESLKRRTTRMETCNTIEPVTMAEFVPAVLRFKMEGWRVVQICAARLPEGYELSYSFGREYEMRTLRLTVGEEETVPSITQIYPGAFLQENEAAELFGVRIEEMAQDYHGKLYRIAGETPFKHKG